MMAHAQKPDFVFPRNGRVHLNRQGRQFRRLLAAQLCASAVVMLDTPCSEIVWRVLAINSIRQFPLHFPSRASPCAIRFQMHYTLNRGLLHAALYAISKICRSTTCHFVQQEGTQDPSKSTQNVDFEWLGADDIQSTTWKGLNVPGLEFPTFWTNIFNVIVGNVFVRRPLLHYAN